MTAPWRQVEVPRGVLPAAYAEIYVSPTQISTYKLCPRKWALGSIAGVKAPQAASAALGEAVHAALEAWLEAGTLPDPSTEAGAIATSMLQHEPTPKTVAVEQWLTVTRDGYTLRGRGDAIRFEPALVVDHKTTSDIATWSKTADVLEHDEQAVIYAAALLERSTACQSVEVRFVYGQTRGARKSKPVTVHLSREHVARVLEQDIEPVARQIVRAKRTITDASELPRNPAACDAFGGCFYRQSRHCVSQNPEERIRSMTQQSMLAGLLAASRAPQPAPAPEPSAPAVTAATPINYIAVDEPLGGSPPAGTAPSLTALLAGTLAAPMRPSGLLEQLRADGYYTPDAAPPPPPLKVKPAPAVPVAETPAPAPAPVAAAPVSTSASSAEVVELRARVALALISAGRDVERVGVEARQIVSDILS